LNSKVWAIVAIVLLIVGFAGGYFSGMAAVPAKPAETVTVTETATTTVTQPATAAEPIKIGVLLELSGDLGPIGQRMLLGAKLAAQQINEQGGFGGRKVQLFIEDGETDTNKAVEAVKKLVEVQGVRIIVGPMISPSTLAVAKYVNDRKVVCISPSATAAKISELGDDYIFRVVGSDAFQSQALIDLIKQGGYEKIATFVVNNDYGIGFEEAFVKEFGDKVVVTIRYDAAKGDYRTELEQVKASGAEAVMFVGYPQSGTTIFRQALDMGLDNIAWFAAEGIAEKVMFKDPKAAEFMAKVAMVGTKPASPTGYAHDLFVKRHREVFGKDPDLYADYTYDATMLAIMAVAQAKSYSGEDIRAALKDVSTRYVGATGYKVFDENGDPMFFDYEVWKVVKTAEGYDFAIIGRWNAATGLVLKE